MKYGLAGVAAGVMVFATGVTLASDNALPGFILSTSVQKTAYDGVSDDLLSGGLNQAGLVSAIPPAVSTPPTTAELRRLALWNNYRGIVDPASGGGIGVFWGPQSPDAPVFAAPVVQGLIPGVEYLAFTRVEDSRGTVNNVTIAVQIPANFDPDKRCVILAPPSGSRGVYGGIAVGEWGLFQGCAVAYGGKGSGTGFHDLDSDTVYDINGHAIDAAAAGRRDIQFQVRDSAKVQAYRQQFPNRVATKHAHSVAHPEVRWGDFVLRSVEFAFWALNDHFGTANGNGNGNGNVQRFDKDSTVVIASGVSNGAGASVRAVEADSQGLIDGLVVTEPSVNPRSAGRFVIRFGTDDFAGHGATLYDDITVMATYAACALKSPSLAGTPLSSIEPLGAPAGASSNRCTSLAEAGLVTGTTDAERSAAAIEALRAIGYYEEIDWGIAFHEVLNLWRSLNATYAASYGRHAVWENLCGVSFAATGADGRPVPASTAVLASLFATSSGIPATAGINLIADRAVEGPILENIATSASTARKDLNFDSARCFRYLSTGDESLLSGGATSADRQDRRRVARGAADVQTSGHLRGRPAIIAYGREDGLVFPNSQSRAYYGLNQAEEGAGSGLRIWEVTPGQHFDAFLSSFLRNPVTGETLFVPLHFYLTEGLRLMLDHLTSGAPLPPSQVVRATPRGLTSYTAADYDTRLPLPVADPGADAISFDASAGVLSIPRD